LLGFSCLPTSEARKALDAATVLLGGGSENRWSQLRSRGLEYLYPKLRWDLSEFRSLLENSSYFRGMLVCPDPFRAHDSTASHPASLPVWQIATRNCSAA